MGNDNVQNSNPHTEDRQDVFDAEKEYINTRRTNHNLDTLSDLKDSWGICFSGGGIRSATLCLGIIQKFIKARIFKCFDYLSTVSGGGYIGSCLTSLLSKPDNCYLKADDIGVEPKNSPFVELNLFSSHKNAAATKLGVWNQMHHLRTHGEYLIPRKDILSRDLQRAVGTLFAGILHHLILFTLLLTALTALVHFGLFSITKYPADTPQIIKELRKQEAPVPPTTAAPFLAELNYEEDTYYKITQNTLVSLKAEKIPQDLIGRLLPLQDKVFYKGRKNFLETLNPIVEEQELREKILKYAANPGDSQLAYVLNEIRTWLFARLGVPLYRMLYEGFISNKGRYLISFIIGVVFCIIAFWQVKKVTQKIYDPSNQAHESAKAGFNLEDHYESKFISGINLASFALMTIGIIFYGIWNLTGTAQPAYYLAALFLPLGFALGFGVWSLIQSNLGRSSRLKEDRVRRSLFNAVQGASFYSIVFSLLIPISLVFLFSINYFNLKFWWSLIALALSFLIFKKSGQGVSEQGGTVTQLLAKFQKFLLSLFLLLFIALLFNIVSDFLIRNVYTSWTIVWPKSLLATNWVPFIICVIFTLVMVVLGFLINSNRISPHYFYRDRLTEAYLKTDARIKRGKNHQKARQGMPLVSIRNHENLLLSQLGENNNKGPYHIIVTALNLQGSDELNRKTMLSEHFIFSKYYVGSKVTGFVKTDKYRDDKTKLARAMTISAAAAGSAMGKFSFAAQAFATTLFNVRLGYWMANPWYYKIESDKNPEPEHPFWPKWLMLEMLNKTTARDRMVNLSDGGHTGDNLGLLPLLQRRCGVIVVCDGEADGDYEFGSFNSAVRMAYIEENITIKIDLSSIVPEKELSSIYQQKEIDGSYKMSQKSVAVGKIIYPPKKAGDDPPEGTLIYLKSSLSEPDTTVRPLPVHVKNYHKGHPNFPHQTTADQFFDDAQFEAYRALGEHIAEQAIEEGKAKILKERCAKADSDPQ